MLYVVGTPIGNLEDLSYRQAKTLAQVDIILAEDTRKTGFLLQKADELYHFPRNVQQRLVSYYKEKEFEKLPEIIQWLEEGKEVVLVSDSGMPLISDPGYLLIKTVIKEQVPFTVIPGPSAVITALIHSGFNPSQFTFMGFLPKKEGEIRKTLNKVKKIKEILPESVIIFYESPERIQKTLPLIAELLPQKQISISRELTKKFEETIRGNISNLPDQTYKGELCIVLF